MFYVNYYLHYTFINMQFKNQRLIPQKNLFFFFVNQKKLYFCDLMIEYEILSKTPNYDGGKRSFSLTDIIFILLTVFSSRHFFCHEIIKYNNNKI